MFSFVCSGRTRVDTPSFFRIQFSRPVYVIVWRFRNFGVKTKKNNEKEKLEKSLTRDFSACCSDREVKIIEMMITTSSRPTHEGKRRVWLQQDIG